jgi:hypothetical protein
MRSKKIILCAGMLAAVAATALLSGCDAARKHVAGAIRPAGAADAVAALRSQITQGNYAQASIEGARFLKDQQDVSGAVAWETAKASAQAGNPSDAIRYAELAIKGGTVAGVDLMAEPLLEPVRSDPRFVALAAGGDDMLQFQVFEPAARLVQASDARAGAGSTGMGGAAGNVSAGRPR